MTAETILFHIISAVICGHEIKPDILAEITQEKMKTIYQLARRHDLAHMIGCVLANTPCAEYPEYAACKNAMNKAIYRYAKLDYEYERICSLFEKERIPFIPLKGAVMRTYYSSPWMRTSCDTDILLHEEDIERATACLVENYGYRLGAKSSHDVSLYSSNNSHIELHYTLIEDGRANTACDVLKDIWQSTVVRNGKEYCREMTDEMFYFYHIAHMAKHFEKGGCGVRPLIDLWLLDNIENADQTRRSFLLARGNLLKFAETARLLCRVWFENEEHNPVTRQMESYILEGGVGGSVENRVKIQQQKMGGKLKYAVSKIFIPYDILKFYYPILQDHIWLTPFMEVHRWCRLTFGGHLKRSIRELEYNRNLSNADVMNVRRFLRDIGL